ncbi:hemin-degrading factor [Nissabacter sp. SGAir0207]|uniref:hemin-degrading factor n=1 Tax=Nissabacter sp. SGAir0207 TaxID=2126321 RepID=UPI001F0D724A|nr:ChuX/HutX family heme-like substrate-binding protein [Nissabacter sp. SGAir0207]
MADYYTQFLTLKHAQPRLYARDLAHQMGVSEAELTAARVGHDAVRLALAPPTLLAALETVGETKTLARNAYAVHEQIGHYRNLTLTPHGGLVLNPRALDLRLFTGQWQSAFALEEAHPQGVRRSLQIFDTHGDAVLKIYATPHTDLAAWQALVAQFTSPDNPPLALDAPVSPASGEADLTGFEVGWRGMTNVHQFFVLLKKYQLTRQQAFRAVPADLAQQVDNRALAQLLTAAQQRGNEIMIFVGNRGVVQIFTGAIHEVTPMHGWLNVFNPHFTLHLQDQQIAESWITRKPTADGMVTSLELFAADGTQIAQLYGQRHEGEPEQAVWREQLAQLVKPAGAVA